MSFNIANDNQYNVIPAKNKQDTKSNQNMKIESQKS